MIQRGFLREHSSIAIILYAATDLVAIVAASLIAHFIRFNTISLAPSYRTVLILGILLTLLLFPRFGLYDSWRGRSLAEQARNLTLAWGSVLFGLIFIGFALKATGSFSRLWIGYWGIIAWALLVFGRSFATVTLRELRRKGHNYRQIAIVGSGALAQGVIKHVKDADWSGLRISWVVDDCANVTDQVESNDIWYWRRVDQLEQELIRRRVDEVWICLPLKEQEQIERILYALRHSTVTQRLLPDLTGIRLVQHPITEILGMPMLNVNLTPMQGMNRLLKACEDKILALFFLLITSPLLALIAIAVKLSSPGPIIYKQRRHGAGGRSINVYKFRTMTVHHEPNGDVTQAKKCDERITRTGAFLRRTSLDELPQLINVLQGKMSIVGPRPHALAHNEFYKDQIETYMQRHKVKPGITGWAQINGWRGETDTLAKMRKRIEYDMYYIENWSILFDIKIIILTIFKGFINKNAY